MDSRDIAIPQPPSRSIEKTLSFDKRLGLKGEAGSGYDYAIAELRDLEIHFFLHETQEL